MGNLYVVGLGIKDKISSNIDKFVKNELNLSEGYYINENIPFTSDSSIEEALMFSDIADLSIVTNSNSKYFISDIKQIEHYRMENFFDMLSFAHSKIYQTPNKYVLIHIISNENRTISFLITADKRTNIVFAKIKFIDGENKLIGEKDIYTVARDFLRHCLTVYNNFGQRENESTSINMKIQFGEVLFFEPDRRSIATSWCIVPVSFNDESELISKLLCLSKESIKFDLSDIAYKYIRGFNDSEKCMIFLEQSNGQLREDIIYVQKAIKEKSLSKVGERDRIFYSFIKKQGKIAFMSPPGGMNNSKMYLKSRNTIKSFDAEIKSLLNGLALGDSTISGYIRDFEHTYQARQLLENIGVRPNVIIGASMGEISNYLSEACLYKRGDNSDTSKKTVVEDLTNILEAMFNTQFDEAKKFYGYIPDDWESWYIKYNVNDIKEILEHEKEAFVTVVGSDSDCIVNGNSAVLKDKIVGLDNSFYYKLQDANFIHTPIMKKSAKKIHDRLVKHGIYLASDEISHDVYSSYYRCPMKNDIEMFAVNFQSIISETVDFSLILKRMYSNDVKIFIDLGTSELCSMWVKNTLKEDVVVCNLFSLAKSTVEFLTFICRIILHSSNIDIKKCFSYFCFTTPRIHRVVNAENDVSDYIKKQIELNEMTLKSYYQTQNSILRTHHSLRNNIDFGEKVLFTRNELLEMTINGMSLYLGDAYNKSDNYLVRTRMPIPPYLFVDRVIDIVAEYGKLQPSRIISEYDISEECILRKGGNHVSQVIVSEASHNSIFLLAYMGVDTIFEGQRRFRIAYAETEYIREEQFYIGDSLRIEFFMDEFVITTESILIKCHYLAKKNGKKIFACNCIGGLFTMDELLSVNQEDKVAVIEQYSNEDNFTEAQMRAYYQGNLLKCFNIDQCNMLYNDFFVEKEAQLIDKIIAISKTNGHSDHGFAIAEKRISDDFWPFRCHFLNDPVLPGTIMIEGINQLTEFFIHYAGIIEGMAVYEVCNIQKTKYRFVRQVLPGKKVIKYFIVVKKIIKTNKGIEISLNGIVYDDNKVVLEIENIVTKIKTMR